MVSEQEAQCPVRANGETGRTRKIIFRDDAVLHFVVIADVVGGDSANHRFHLPAISIIDKTRRRRAGNGDEAVLGVASTLLLSRPKLIDCVGHK